MNLLKIYNLVATAIIVILCVYCSYLQQNSGMIDLQQTGIYIELGKTQQDLRETEDLLQQCDKKYIEAIGLKNEK
jgi:hypothetical protein